MGDAGGHGGGAAATPLSMPPHALKTRMPVPPPPAPACKLINAVDTGTLCDGCWNTQTTSSPIYTPCMTGCSHSSWYCLLGGEPDCNLGCSSFCSYTSTYR